MATIDQLQPFETIRRMELGDPAVSPYGIEEVNRLLSRRYGKTLPEGFLAEYITGMGKFPIRVASFMRSYYSIEIEPTVKEEIGNIASKFAARADSIIYDITPRIMDWPAGSFGNYRSCFRGSHKNSVAALLAIGAVAFRLFKPGGTWYGRYKGIGRAWLIPHEGHILVTNGYGPKTTADYAEIVSKIVGEPYSEVRRIKSTENVIYVNNGTGCVVGPERFTEINITMKWIGMEICSACGNRFTFYESDTNWCQHDGRYYCRACVGRCSITNKILPHYRLVYAPGAIVKHNGKTIQIEEFISDEYSERLLVACNKCDRLFGKDQGHECHGN